MGKSKTKIGIMFTKSRLIMLSDLAENESNIIEELEIDTSLIYKKKPDECPCCSSDNIKGLEVMATYDGNLFWECYECEALFLRFNEKTTLKYLKKAVGLWTNPEDWAYVPRSEFN